MLPQLLLQELAGAAVWWLPYWLDSFGNLKRTPNRPHLSSLPLLLHICFCVNHTDCFRSFPPTPHYPAPSSCCHRSWRVLLLSCCPAGWTASATPKRTSTRCYLCCHYLAPPYSASGCLPFCKCPMLTPPSLHPPAPSSCCRRSWQVLLLSCCPTGWTALATPHALTMVQGTRRPLWPSCTAWQLWGW